MSPSLCRLWVNLNLWLSREIHIYLEPNNPPAGSVRYCTVWIFFTVGLAQSACLMQILLYSSNSNFGIKLTMLILTFYMRLKSSTWYCSYSLISLIRHHCSLTLHFTKYTTKIYCALKFTLYLLKMYENKFLTNLGKTTLNLKIYTVILLYNSVNSVIRYITTYHIFSFDSEK